MNYNEIKELRNKYANAIVNYYANEAGVDEYAFRRTVAYLRDVCFNEMLDWGEISKWLIADYQEADEEEKKTYFTESNYLELEDRLYNSFM